MNIVLLIVVCLVCCVFVTVKTKLFKNAVKIKLGSSHQNHWWKKKRLILYTTKRGLPRAIYFRLLKPYPGTPNPAWRTALTCHAVPLPRLESVSGKSSLKQSTPSAPRPEVLCLPRVSQWIPKTLTTCDATSQLQRCRQLPCSSGVVFRAGRLE